MRLMEFGPIPSLLSNLPPCPACRITSTLRNGTDARTDLGLCLSICQGDLQRESRRLQEFVQPHHAKEDGGTRSAEWCGGLPAERRELVRGC